MGLFRAIYRWKLKRTFARYKLSGDILAQLTDTSRMTKWEAFCSLYIPRYPLRAFRKKVQSGEISLHTLITLQKTIEKALEGTPEGDRLKDE